MHFPTWLSHWDRFLPQFWNTNIKTGVDSESKLHNIWGEGRGDWRVGQEFVTHISNFCFVKNKSVTDTDKAIVDFQCNFCNLYLAILHLFVCLFVFFWSLDLPNSSYFFTGWILFTWSDFRAEIFAFLEIFFRISELQNSQCISKDFVLLLVKWLLNYTCSFSPQIVWTFHLIMYGP